jgi:hypothetical protein
MDARHYELIAQMVSQNATTEQQAAFDACFCADAEFREQFHLAEQWFRHKAPSTPSFDSHSAFESLRQKLNR